MKIHYWARMIMVLSVFMLTAGSTSLITPHVTAATSTVALPTIEGPIPITPTSHIWNGAAWQWVPIDLSKYRYTEEEFYVSGVSNVYQAIPYSDYEAEVLRSGPYTTRITIRRPVDMKKWSGVVAVEIINMSAYYDWTANWGALWESIIARGDVYVGITSKPNVFPGLVRFDAARYERLSMANPLPPEEQTCGTYPGDPDYDLNNSRLYENGLAFDIFSQVGALLKSDHPSNPLGKPAKRAYLVGESQSGAYIINYYKYLHPSQTLDGGKPVYDGYLIEDWTTAPGPVEDWGGYLFVKLNQCAPPLAEDDPQNVLPGRSAPLVVINSEVFYPINGRPQNSNAEDNKFWLWMAAGASHGWTFQYDYSDAAYADLLKANLFDPNFPHFTCGPNQPEINLYMFEKALYGYLDNWVLTGTPPPAAPDPVVVNGEYARDQYGNTLGGLRMPEMDVPVATYTGVLVPSVDCTSAVTPFSDELLAQLYKNHGQYLTQFTAAAKRLEQQGFLLHGDAMKLRRAAAQAPIP